MPCYMCRTTKGPFQMLEVARLRFIRKAQPHFRDNSYLCLKCFEQFEKIYQAKSKSKSNNSNSSRTSISNASTRSVSTSNLNSKGSSHEMSPVTAIEREDNNNSDDPSVVHFDSRSIESHTSIDSTDRIVRMAPAFVTLRDSTRKTIRNPGLNVARQGAEAAVSMALRSQEEATGAQTTGNDNSGKEQSSESLVHFDSRSTNSVSSVDTTDRIVRMVPEFLEIADSTRKTANNPELNIARQEAEAAVRNTSKRQKIATPARTRDRLQIVDEESSEDEDIASQLSPNNLAHVRPVVRRRKGAVVRQFDDVMDQYLARTSGG